MIVSPMIVSALNRTLQVWRPSTAADGAGGQTVTLIQVGQVAAMISQPSATERFEAAQAGGEHSHNVYLLPVADVRRGDELRGDGQTFRVLAIVEPSRPAYRKALCERIEAGG